MNSEELKILYWNANGISNKKVEFVNFVKRHDFDVIAIVETFLKPTNRFSVTNYTCVRLDRASGPKGGILVLIKKSIAFSIMCDQNLKTIEALGIQVCTRKGPLCIMAAYNPGAISQAVEFEQDIRKLTSRKGNFLICGDLNARHRFWNCISSNPAGKRLFNELQKGQF